LAALDAKIRAHLRVEIRALIDRLGITTVYVTHDQEEALSISDRVAVMDYGKILQVGGPMDVYLRPTGNFVVITARWWSRVTRCRSGCPRTFAGKTPAWSVCGPSTST
jgi:ABC-type sugar transport system ATPase subunit